MSKSLRALFKRIVPAKYIMAQRVINELDTVINLSFKSVTHTETSNLFCWCACACTSGSRERRLRRAGSFCAASVSCTLARSEGEGEGAGIGLSASGTGHGSLQHVVWVSKRISRDCRRANPQSLSRAFRSSKQNLHRRTQLED